MLIVEKRCCRQSKRQGESCSSLFFEYFLLIERRFKSFKPPSLSMCVSEQIVCVSVCVYVYVCVCVCLCVCL